MFEMQKISLPPIGTGIHVTVAARKPPSRNWSKYKKVLIDNPRDSNLLQRQKLWNFQKLNRGAFRSQLTSLPDIPYRAHGHPAEKVDVAVQADLTNRFSHTLRVIFPNLSNKIGLKSKTNTEESKTNTDDAGEEENGEIVNGDVKNINEDLEELSDLGLDYESIVRKKNVGTMTMLQDSYKPSDRKKTTPRETKPEKENLPILKPKTNVYLTQTPLNKKKSVKFKQTKEVPDTNSEKNGENEGEIKDAEENGLDNENNEESEEEIISVLPKVEITELSERIPSPAPSLESLSLDIPVENVGHSSNSMANSVNILDFISGNITDRSERSDYPSGRRAKFISDPDADRLWFEKLVGDKEVIDYGSYANFARLPQNVDTLKVSDNEKADFSKGYQRKNFTPRINDEFSVYHSNQSKNSNIAPANVNKGGKNSKRGVIYVGKSY